MQPTVIIKIGRDGGTIEMSGENFTGNTCTKAMEPFKRINGEVISDTILPEYYQTDVQQQQVFE